ncbi:hypothetical protein ZIOFF_055186 [Zingiber officinale]|uniref:CCHC-type domain-containing protein n=1 Tax=Zingiber officinale TaxID=94328 RepID=A0A8J5FIS0_ZINOF|nr:hypothetical protein ZIOFF_055186 [Zingiber officinale]
MATSSSSMFFTYSPSQNPIFDGEHYDYWSSQMETIFLSQDLWSIINKDDNSSSDEGEATTSEEKGKAVKEIVIEKAAKENVMKDAMALRILQQSQEQKDCAENNRESYGRGGRSRGRGRGHAGSQFRRDDQFWNRSGNIKGNCYVCKKAGHESKDCHFRCRRCKIPNHSERDCYYKNKQQQQQSSQSTVNFSKENESKQVFYSCFNTVEDMNEVWFLDSGSSNHVTGNKEHFVEIDNSYNSLLELGDSKKLKIEGKGVVAIKAANGEEKQINDVFYSPCITQNLLSVGQIMKKGYKITFADGQCEIVDKNEKRIVGLMLLKEKNMVTGLPRIQPTETGFCEGCVYGKQHQAPVAVPSLNPTNSTAAGSSGTNSENEISEDETPPQRYRSLTDIYEQANLALATFEPQNFEEATKEEQWRNAMKEEMLSIERNDTSVEPSLYVKKCDADFLVACLYMDDLIYTSTSKALLEEFKKAIMDEFEMTDLGLMKYFLGFQVRQSKGEIFISQEKYVDDILKKFHMEKAKAVATPMALNEKLQQYDVQESSGMTTGDVMPISPICNFTTDFGRHSSSRDRVKVCPENEVS